MQLLGGNNNILFLELCLSVIPFLYSTWPLLLARRAESIVIYSDITEKEQAPFDDH